MPAAILDTSTLEPGDSVRWDRAASMAFERLPAQRASSYLIESADDLDVVAVGGQGAALRRLKAALTARLISPGLAAAYRGSRKSNKKGVLLHGPPGCGKTSLIRVVAMHMRSITGHECPIAVVSPGAFETPWVGEAEANIRSCFAMLRKAAGDGVALLVLDEIESIGRIRGGIASGIQDKFLGSLLTELDGFKDRGNVAVVCCTNREDMLDPALLSRITDLQIEIGRPERAGAREIFEVHLPESLPFDESEQDAAAARSAMIDESVSTLFAANGESSAISAIHFRDGNKRAVHARELINGRLIEQLCRAACDQAFLRHQEGAGEGLRASDLRDAVADALARLRTTLSAHNVRAYVDGLPSELDIVRVEPMVPRVERPFRYLHVA